MKNLKIKIKIHGFEIEFEGDEDTVLKQYEEVKNNGLSSLIGTNNIQNPIAIDPKAIQTQNEDRYSNDFPAIQNIIMKSLPNSESEWILIYAFYSSNFGNKEFPREGIRQMYRDTKRGIPQRLNNLSNNIKQNVKNGWFEQLNENDFIITQAGNVKAKEIINRSPQSKSPSTTSKTTKTGLTEKPVTSDVSQNRKLETYSLVDLKLNEDDRIKFKNFFHSIDPIGQNDQILTIALWLKENKGINFIDENIVFTSMRILGIKVPKVISQVLRNLKNDNMLVKNLDGEYSIIHIGEDHVKHNLLKNKKEE